MTMRIPHDRDTPPPMHCQHQIPPAGGSSTTLGFWPPELLERGLGSFRGAVQSHSQSPEKPQQGLEPRLPMCLCGYRMSPCAGAALGKQIHTARLEAWDHDGAQNKHHPENTGLDLHLLSTGK